MIDVCSAPVLIGCNVFWIFVVTMLLNTKSLLIVTKQLVFFFAQKRINNLPIKCFSKWCTCTILDQVKYLGVWINVLWPVAQLYGQVRTDWNQCFVIDCSLSHPAVHKPFTCSHSVLRNTWLNIHAVRWMRFSARLSVHVFTISRKLTWSLFRQWRLERVVVCLIH